MYHLHISKLHKERGVVSLQYLGQKLPNDLVFSQGPLCIQEKAFCCYLPTFWNISTSTVQSLHLGLLTIQSPYKARTFKSFYKLTLWFNFLSTMIQREKEEHFFFSQISLLLFLLGIFKRWDVLKIPMNLVPICITACLSTFKRLGHKWSTKKKVHKPLLLNHLDTLENSAPVYSNRYTSLSPACTDCYFGINFVE